MFTETELRDALQHSARRADQLELRDVAPRPRRRVLLPLAAAAAVVVLAGGAAVLSGRDGGGHETAPPAHVTSAAAAGPSTAAHRGHVSVDLANAIDLLQVTHDDGAYVTVGGNGDAQAGSETVEKFLGAKRTLDLSVVDSAAFDAGRIPRAHPVPIAGTTGYYARFKLYPLDGNSDPGSDKYTSPWTIAFRSPQGNWVFVSIENGVDFDGVNNPDAIVAAYDALGVQFVARQTRIPFRTGYVPDGFALANIVLGHDESMTTLSNGKQTIEIDVLHDRAPGECVSTCGATRRVGTYTINVFADGYDATGSSVAGPTAKIPANGSATLTPAPTPVTDALEQRILDSLTLAADLTDPSTFWTIADALG